MPSLRSVLLLAAIALVMVSCSGSDDDTSSALDGREYVSIDFVEQGLPRSLVANTRITLRFDGERIIANAGCNSMQGTYSIADGRLQTAELSMTEMGCDPERHAQDELVAGVLSAAPVIDIDIDQAILQLTTDTVLLRFADNVFANPARPLIDTLWEVDGFIDDDVATAFAVNEPASLMIGTDSTLKIFGLCQPLVFPVEVAAGDAPNEGVLRFGQRVVPDDDCPDSEYRRSIYNVFANDEATYAIAGTTLTVRTNAGLGMTLRAVE